MTLSRRDFLFQTAALGVGGTLVGAATGCATGSGLSRALTGALKPGQGAATALGLRCPALETVRVGVIGLGMRGPGAVQLYPTLPNVRLVALCDQFEDRVAAQQKWLKENGKPDVASYAGSPEAWKKLCESDQVDLVHITTPWILHAPMAVYAMQCGKHVAIEVPAAVTVDECWELVETAEKTQRHCMILENCCYGETEMFALMLCRRGVLGDLVHGEAAYIHDLRELKFQEGAYVDLWRLQFSKDHNGNPYPTHGLGPVCQYMNINHGDCFEYLSSISSNQFGLSRYAAAKHGADSAQAKAEYKLGDMNTTIIKTRRGRTIMLQHDTTSPRPYTRINLISGTKGILADYPLRVALDPSAHGWMNDEALKALMAQYTHPMWASHGKTAVEVGGHGGMDYLLLARLCHCLRQGLPLDIDVYDTASWSCLVELSERSVLGRGKSIDVPDFTRGGWQTAEPLGIVDLG